MAATDTTARRILSKSQAVKGRVATVLVHPGGRRAGYLMPEGTSPDKAFAWGQQRHPWPESVFVLPLLDAETDGPPLLAERSPE